jgi:hypothetical protein
VTDRGFHSAPVVSFWNFLVAERLTHFFKVSILNSERNWCSSNTDISRDYAFISVIHVIFGPQTYFALFLLYALPFENKISLIGHGVRIQVTEIAPPQWPHCPVSPYFNKVTQQNLWLIHIYWYCPVFGVSVTNNNGFSIRWLDLFGASLQLQPIITTHDQSSVEGFFLDRRGLSSFSFSFYDRLQTTFVVYNPSARTTHRKHIENTVSTENLFASPSNAYPLLARRVYRHIA